MMLLSLGANAQTMEKSYVNHLLDSVNVIESRDNLFPNTKRVIVRNYRMIFFLNHGVVVDKPETFFPDVKRTFVRRDRLVIVFDRKEMKKYTVTRIGKVRVNIP